MTKILIGYVLSVGLWVGTVVFVALAFTAGDTLPGNQLPINIELFFLAAVLVILPICLVVWSIRGIRNGTMSKAGLGITLIAGLYIAFLVFYVGGKSLSILSADPQQPHAGIFGQQPIQENAQIGR